MSQLPIHLKSIKFFIMSVCFCLTIHPTIASNDMGEQNQSEARSWRYKATKWVFDHPLLVTSAVVAGSAVAYYFTMTTEEVPKEQRKPSPLCFDMPQDYLYALAQNVSFSFESFTSKITGWISWCHSPEFYDGQYNGGVPMYSSFKECLTDCMSNFKTTGVSNYKCFNFVRCLGEPDSKWLSCQYPIFGWWHTDEDIYKDYLNRTDHPLPSWHGVMNTRLNMDGFSFDGSKRFHFDPDKDLMALWRCGQIPVDPEFKL